MAIFDQVPSRPCPFCGSPSRSQRQIPVANPRSFTFWRVCEGCEASSDPVTTQNRALTVLLAILAWNIHVVRRNR